MRGAGRLLLLLLLLVPALPASGFADQSALDLNEAAGAIDLTPYAQVYEDRSDREPFARVRRETFRPVSRLVFAQRGSVYWVRLRVQGATADRPWLLDAGRRPSVADLYAPSANGRYAVTPNGASIPYAKREQRTLNRIAFALPESPQPQTIYLRLLSTEPRVDLTAYTRARFDAVTSNDLLVATGLLSVLGALALAALLLFFVTRDPRYLLYAIALVCAMLYRANGFGLLGADLFAGRSFPYVRTEVFFNGLVLLAASAFIRAFLRGWHERRLPDRAIAGMAILGALYAIAALAGAPVPYSAVEIFAYFYVGVWLLTGIAAWWRGYRPAAWLTVASAALMAGMALHRPDAGIALSAVLLLVSLTPLRAQGVGGDVQCA